MTSSRDVETRPHRVTIVERLVVLYEAAFADAVQDRAYPEHMKRSLF